jgi:hypothetical protein
VLLRVLNNRERLAFWYALLQEVMSWPFHSPRMIDSAGKVSLLARDMSCRMVMARCQGTRFLLIGMLNQS